MPTALGNGKTIRDVINSMSDEQKEVLYFLLATSSKKKSEWKSAWQLIAGESFTFLQNNKEDQK